MRIYVDSSALIKRALCEDESPALIDAVDQWMSQQSVLYSSTLRSLDAIHLATATLIGADLVCAYDQRMLTAAAELGFRTISPA